jgi:ankyrin repeat protein
MGSPLLEAVRRGDAAAVQALATPDAVNATGAEGVTPLMVAAGAGRLDLITVLLAAGADLHAADERGYTALFFACHDAEADCGHPEVVVLLARAGADIEAPIGFGVRPLMYAAGNGEAGVVRALLDCGADPLARNEFGRTALMMVKERHYVDVINLLHEAEARLEIETGCQSRNAPDRQVVTFVKSPRRP